MIRRIFFLVFIGFLLTPLVPYAKTDVSGSYKHGGGDHITIQIKVSAPPPMAFIVLQHLPKGVKLLSADPRPSGSGKGASSVKWLFKHARPGKHKLKMQLSKPVDPKQLRGEIRFRHPQSGAMITRKIR